jgi:8-oxo-dGTP diphosphatase
MLDVTCAIILNNNKVLVTQRSEAMKLPMKWEFPGGKIQAGETEEECIQRELKEELGINVRIIKNLTSCEYDYGTFCINLIPFLVEYISGKVQLAEHRDAKWLTKEELIRLDFAPADKPILYELLQSNYV